MTFLAVRLAIVSAARVTVGRPDVDWPVHFCGVVRCHVFARADVPRSSFDSPATRPEWSVPDERTMSATRSGTSCRDPPR